MIVILVDPMITMHDDKNYPRNYNSIITINPDSIMTGEYLYPKITHT